MKQASRQPMEREAPPQTRASHSHVHGHSHGHHPQEMAFASRRPAPSSAMHTHSSAPPASGLASSQLPQLRERITFPSQSSQASMDHEWDIPTFQRRSGG